jgi:hypothetical protein
VLLGDAPIDWSRIKRAEDVRPFDLAKGRHFAELTLKEVVGKGRRALMIFGDSHLQGRGLRENVPINIIERSPARPKVFTISSSFIDLTKVQEDVGGWPVPSLASIRGTVIGAKPLAAFYPIPPAPGWNLLSMEDTFDAVLYLGPPSSMTMSRLSAAQCADANYMKMRLARMEFDAVQVRKERIEFLQRLCASLPTPQTGSKP